MLTKRFLRHHLLLLMLLSLALPRPATAQAPTTTTAASQTNPSVAGASVNFTATVSSGTVGVTGTVQFSADGTNFGAAVPVSAGTGNSVTSAAVSNTFATAGPHTVTASFTPLVPANFAASSGSVNQVVKSTTSFSAFTALPASPSVYGQQITFSATITGSFGIPTGTIQFQANGSPLGPPVSLNASGAASYATSSLPVSGSPYAITGIYSGDSFNVSSNGTLAGGYTVNKDGTSVTVPSSSASTSVFGQSVTLSATVTAVTGGANAPTGTIKFTDGSGFTATGTVDAGGAASVTTSGLSAGTHAITATYNGDTNFTASVSPGSLTQTVNKDATVTVVTSSANPSLLSQTVTFTATVTNSSGGQTPSGTVQFQDGGTNIGTPVTLAGGQGQLADAALSVGSHSITAVYSGDVNSASGTSAALSQTVNPAMTSVALTSLPNPSTFNSSVTFKATVAGNSAATPGGTVTFTVDGVTHAPDSSAQSGSDLVATYSLSTLSVGNHNITASYSGDGNFSSAASGSLTQIVNGGATSTTSLSSSPNPSSFGTPVTLTATVVGTGGTPTGQVTFKDTFNGSTNTIGTGTLSASGPADTAIATFTTSSLAVAPATTPHVITAVYAGDGTFISSTSSAVNQVVNQAGNSTVVTSSSPTSSFGQSVTFTAVVTGSSVTPTGTVTFTDGPDTIGSATLSPTGNTNEASAMVTTSLLAVGGHTITASYGGDASNSTSSNTVAQTVTQATPTISLASDTNPSTLNQQVTFTATVAAINGVTPTGTVQFQDGGTNIGTPVTLDPNGVAAFPTQALTVGSHTITALYGGDATYNSAAATLTQVVTAAASTTTLTSDINPSQFNGKVTFTAIVTGPGATPTGSVTFQDGTNPIGTATLDATGTATLSTATLSVGVHSITAVYSGDGNFGASSSAPPLTQNVNKGATSVALISSLNPANFNDAVKFTATVTAPGGGGTPTGSVTFLDGTTPIGTTNLDATGLASLQIATLATGTHKITAVYSGDGNFAGATSGVVSQVINPSSSSVSISSSVNPSSYRQPITYTVTVTGRVTPSGTVTFLDGSTPIGDPNNPANLSPSGVSGQASASFTFPGLTVGSHTITAAYSGDKSYGAGSQSLTQVVNKTPPTVSVVTNSPQPARGDSITFTATVIGPSGGALPTGTVQFQDGSANIGKPVKLTNGQGQLADAALSVGSHTITAVYSGDGNYTTQQGSVSQTVFDTSTSITAISPDHMLVPGSVRPSLGTVIKTSDPQTLTITGTGFAAGATVLFRNQTAGASLPIDGQRLVPDAPPTTDASGVSTLTVTVPPALAATAGLISVEVDNPSPQPNKTPRVFPNFPINPVQTVQTFSLGSSAYLRMFSIPYDYTGVNPYDVLQGVQLTTSSSPAYDPDLNNLLGVSLFTDASQLPLYHWDTSQVRYLATVSQGSGQTPDNLQLTLGQAYWATSKLASAALLGVMRLGTPATFNPSGISLQPGWNMVGDPFPSDAALANLQVLYQGVNLPYYGAGSGVSSGIVSPIFWSYEQMPSGPPDYQINYSGLTGHDVMRAYEGYWVYCYQPCTLLVTK